MGVPLSAVPTHVHKHKGGSWNKKLQEHLDDIASRCNLDTVLPIISSSVEAIPMIEGLNVMDGFGCLYCGYSSKTSKTVQTHIRTSHDSATSTKIGSFQLSRMTGSTKDPLFRVQGSVALIPPLLQDAAESQVQEFAKLVVEFDWKIFQQAELPNPRMVSPWLLRSAFHVHTQGYNTKELFELAKPPAKDEFNGLHKAVTAFFDKSTDLIDNTEEIVLQKLNTSDIQKR